MNAAELELAQKVGKLVPPAQGALCVWRDARWDEDLVWVARHPAGRRYELAYQEDGWVPDLDDSCTCYGTLLLWLIKRYPEEGSLRWVGAAHTVGVYPSYNEIGGRWTLEAGDALGAALATAIVAMAK